METGKEAVILHAETDAQFPDAKEPLPPECAIKVFKTTLSEFKQRDKYIKDDHRFKDRVGKCLFVDFVTKCKITLIFNCYSHTT